MKYRAFAVGLVKTKKRHTSNRKQKGKPIAPQKVDSKKTTKKKTDIVQKSEEINKKLVDIEEKPEEKPEKIDIDPLHPDRCIPDKLNLIDNYYGNLCKSCWYAYEISNLVMHGVMAAPCCVMNDLYKKYKQKCYIPNCTDPQTDTELLKDVEIDF